jgi:hypothetical protein
MVSVSKRAEVPDLLASLLDSALGALKTKQSSAVEHKLIGILCVCAEPVALSRFRRSRASIAPRQALQQGVQPVTLLYEQ